MDQPPLIPVFIPALVAVLQRAEKLKGAPLTEEEVLSIRDRSPCMMLSRSDVAMLAGKRGYDDLDPNRAWEQWQEVRATLHQPPPRSTEDP